MVGAAVGQQLVDDFAVAIHALQLEKRPFVGRQSQPAHAVDDRRHRCRRRTLDVGVLDAQDEGAVEMARVGPGVERGPDAADVQEARGTGGEAGADGRSGRRMVGGAAQVLRSRMLT